MTAHERFNLGLRELPLPGDTLNLQHGRRRADMGIQPACRCQNQIGRDRRIERSKIVFLANFSYSLFYLLQKFGIRRSEIAA